MTAVPDQEIYIVSYFDPIFKETTSKQVSKSELKDLELILEKIRAIDVRIWRFMVSGEPIQATTYTKVLLT